MEATADLQELYWNKILPSGVITKGKQKEIIDLVTDFPWTAQSLSSKQGRDDSITFTHNIPYCYAIERQLTVGTNVTSVINTILGNVGSMMESVNRVGKNIIGNETGQKLVQGMTGINVNDLQLNSNSPNSGASNASASSANGGESESGAAETGESSTSNTPKTNEKSQQEGPVPKPSGEEGQEGNVKKNNKDSTKTENSNTQDNSALKTILSNVENLAGALKEMVANFESEDTKMKEGNLANTPFLRPWRWLYFTKVTGKRYIFPTFSSNELFKMTSQWGSGDNPFKEITDTMESWAYRMRTVADITDFFPQTDGASRYMGYKLEYAKGFNYNPDNCPSLKSDFVLFNTVKKDAWRKNYRFLLMFLLRNLALRTSIYAFQPPLLYDIIVPGVKHLPLCYVENIEVTPEGHVRNMSGDNILKEIVSDVKNDTIQIPVPEAWRVGISFKCVIPDTMNLILNTTTFPINVTMKNA